MDCREITKVEKEITKDIMNRTNLTEKEAQEIAWQCERYGYTIHQQKYFKLKKAIEILKDKDINKVYFEMTTDHITYNSFLDYGNNNKLTQEEYKLLKEVLE